MALAVSTFDDALAFTLGWESGYANIVGDRGGETYRGIARNYHGDWPGWGFVDAQAHPIERGTIFPELEDAVRAFYRTKFWEPFNCSALPPRTACVLFDWAVTSWDDGAKALQRIVGVDPDGDIGPKTLAAIQAWSDKQLAIALLVKRREYVAGLKSSANDAGWNKRNNALAVLITGARGELDMGNNPWTTVLGWIALVGAVCTAIVGVSHGTMDFQAALGLVTGAAGGAGLIKAADAK